MTVRRTWINSAVWFVTPTMRFDSQEMYCEIETEMNGLYREADFFSKAKFEGINFGLFYSKDRPEEVKLGRVGVKTNRLSIVITVDGRKWETLRTPELKEHVTRLMVRAVIAAGQRYKLPVEPFERRLGKRGG